MSIKLLFFSSILILSFKNIEPRCEKLKNGKYHVVFDKRFKAYHNYDLTIKGDKYFKSLKDENVDSGAIVWIQKCYFKLNSISKNRQESDTAFSQKMKKSFGDECIELREIREDTINFRTAYEANLNIIMSEGKLIKTK